jgi:hypothetical protein
MWNAGNCVSRSTMTDKNQFWITDFQVFHWSILHFVVLPSQSSSLHRYLWFCSSAIGFRCEIQCIDLTLRSRDCLNEQFMKSVVWAKCPNLLTIKTMVVNSRHVRMASRAWQFLVLWSQYGWDDTFSVKYSLNWAACLRSNCSSDINYT